MPAARDAMGLIICGKLFFFVFTMVMGMGMSVRWKRMVGERLVYLVVN